MTMAFKCDDCKSYFDTPKEKPGATYVHHAIILDDDGRESHHRLEAHLCDDCAITLSVRLSLYPREGSGQ